MYVQVFFIALSLLLATSVVGSFALVCDDGESSEKYNEYFTVMTRGRRNEIAYRYRKRFQC